jgi:hypothetical protein
MAFSSSFYDDPMLGQENVAATSRYALDQGSEAQKKSSCIGEEEIQFFTASEHGGISATNFASPSVASYALSGAESFGSQLSESFNVPGSVQSSASGVNRTVDTADWENDFENSEEGNSQFDMTSTFTKQERSIEEWTVDLGAANLVPGYDMTSMPSISQVQSPSDLGVASNYM